MKARTVKRNVRLWTAVLLVGIFLAPGFAFSWDRGPGRQDGKGWCGKKGYGTAMGCRPGRILGVWKNPKAVEELGLSEEQVTKLKEADFATREKRIDLRAKLENFELELEKAFSESTVDENRVRQIAGQIKEVRGEMFMGRIESWMTVKKTLSPEQIEKLEEKRMERPRHRGWSGHDDDYGRHARKYRD